MNLDRVEYNDVTDKQREVSNDDEAPVLTSGLAKNLITQHLIALEKKDYETSQKMQW